MPFFVQSSDSPLIVTTDEDSIISPAFSTSTNEETAGMIPWLPISPFTTDVVGIPRIPSPSILKSTNRFHGVMNQTSSHQTSFPITPKIEVQGIDYFKFENQRFKSRVTDRLKLKIRGIIHSIFEGFKSLKTSTNQERYQFIKPSRRTRSRTRRWLRLLSLIGFMILLMNLIGFKIYQHLISFDFRIHQDEEDDSEILNQPWISKLSNQYMKRLDVKMKDKRVKVMKIDDDDLKPHLIENLIQEAQTNWQKKVSKQSHSLSMAIEVYRER